jgi:aspartyl-tRNA(Asn)/glutamyl-tRNA(Gln) amidotransferase subunit A
MELHQLTISALHEQLIEGNITATDITLSVLDHIEQIQPHLNAYITVDRELALQQAAVADDEFTRDNIRSPLQGIPIAVKDNICTKGLRTTCASHILQDFVPPYDATVIQRLRTAGAVIVGKTNLDEFAMGSSTESSYFAPVRNPWDLEFVPGGSSGGSAAAVASDACIAALGSDTGGSIRQPAALTGIVGLKPTYGRISRYGLVAFASSLDQIGPLTKDVRDAACLLQSIAGHDPYDSTCGNLSVPDYLSALERGVAGMRLGIPREYFTHGIDTRVEQAVRSGIETLQGLGAEPVDVSLPHTPYAVATYYILANAEASSNLARYDGVRYGTRAKQYGDLLDMYTTTRSQGFGLEVKRRIMLGTYALSAGYYDAYYRKAQQLRTLFCQDFATAFQQCDALLTPVSPAPGFRLGEWLDDPLQMYLADIFTIPVNLAGLPAISIPCGYTADPLPIGMQIIAAPFQEERLLQIAAAFESATNFHLRKPDLPLESI